MRNEPRTSSKVLSAVVYIAIGIATASYGKAASASVPVEEQSTASKEAADTVIGLIAESHIRPDERVVDSFATASHWRKAPIKTNTLLNAKVGYAGKLAGQTAFLGSDGTNEIFSIALRDQFQPADAINEFRGVYTLNKQDTEDSDGERCDTYLLVDYGTDVGLLMLTYGVADAIKGTGTIAFITMARVKRELAKKH